LTRISRASRWRVASTSSAPGGWAASGWRVTPPGSSGGSSSPYSQPPGQIGPVAQVDEEPLQLEAAAQQQLEGERDVGGQGDALAQLLQPPVDGRGLPRVAGEAVGGPQVQGVGVHHQPQEDLEVLDELGVAGVRAAQAGLLAGVAPPPDQQPLQQPTLLEHGLAEGGAGRQGTTSSVGAARRDSITGVDSSGCLPTRSVPGAPRARAKGVRRC